MSRTAQTAAQIQRKATLRPHRTRTAILDVMASYGQPITPTQLSEITGESLGATAYHVRTLASAGVIVFVRDERVRGAIANFYALVPDNSELIAPDELLLELAGALAMPSSDGYPIKTVLDDEARALLAKERERVVPRVRKIAEAANKRAASAAANGTAPA